MRKSHFPVIKSGSNRHDEETGADANSQSNERTDIQFDDYNRQPRPPSTRNYIPSNISGMSPKRERIVQSDAVHNYRAYNNSNNSDPEDREYDASIGYYMGAHTKQAVDPRAFGPRARPHAGAGLAGLNHPSQPGAGRQRKDKGGRAGPGYNPAHRTPHKGSGNLHIRADTVDTEQLDYINDLESHIATGQRNIAAWKIRYYVEFFRLLASRSYNKDIKKQLRDTEKEVVDLEHHATELSRRNAELSHQLEAMGLDQGWVDSARAVNEIDGERCAHLKKMHEEELRHLRAELEKHAITDTVVQDTVISNTQLQGAVAQALSEKDNMALMLEEERSKHADTLSLATARLQLVEELKIQLKDSMTQIQDLHRDHDIEYIQSLRDALKEEVEAAKELRHLNMDSQKKIQRLEERLDKEEENYLSQKERFEQIISAKDAKFAIESQSLQDQIVVLKKNADYSTSTERTNKDGKINVIVSKQTRKLQEELEGLQNESRQLVTARLDIRLLENELKALRVNTKSMQLELRETKDENIVIEQELNATKVDCRQHKSNAMDLRSQNDSLKHQLEASRQEVIALKTGEAEQALQKEFNNNMEKLHATYQVKLADANDRFEKTVQNHADFVEELNQKHAEGLEETNMRYVNALNLANQRCETLSNELSSALKFIEEVEGQGAINTYAEVMKQAKRQKRIDSESSSDDESYTSDYSGKYRDSEEEMKAIERRAARRASGKAERDSVRNENIDEACVDGAGSVHDINQDSTSSDSEDTTDAGKVRKETVSRQLAMTKRKKKTKQKMELEAMKKLTVINEERLSTVVSTIEDKIRTMTDVIVPAISPERSLSPFMLDTSTSVASKMQASLTQPHIQRKLAPSLHYINPNVVLHGEDYYDVTILTRQLDELWRRYECRGMALADQEVTIHTQADEIGHAVVYSRFLEEELFTARKKEKEGFSSMQGNAAAAGIGQNKQRPDGKHQSDSRVVPGVSILGGSVAAGSTLDEFFGITNAPTPEESLQLLTKIQLNSGSDVGLDGLQDIIPWSFNPFLSQDGEEKTKRYDSREKCAILKAELEAQAAQLHSYVEDTLSGPFHVKMKSRSSLQEWVLAFIQIYDRKPTEADKLKSHKFAVLAEHYRDVQSKLHIAIESLKDPSFYAEQKRISFEAAADNISQLSGYRPENFEHSLRIDPTLPWLVHENPLAVTEAFPEWWFPLVFKHTTEHPIHHSIRTEGDTYFTPEDVAHAEVFTKEYRESEEKLKKEQAQREEELEKMCAKMQTDIFQLLSEKQESQQIIYALQKETESAKKLASDAAQSLADAQEEIKAAYQKAQEDEMKAQLKQQQVDKLREETMTAEKLAAEKVSRLQSQSQQSTKRMYTLRNSTTASATTSRSKVVGNDGSPTAQNTSKNQAPLFVEPPLTRDKAKSTEKDVEINAVRGRTALQGKAASSNNGAVKIPDMCVFQDAKESDDDSDEDGEVEFKSDMLSEIGKLSAEKPHGFARQADPLALIKVSGVKETAVEEKKELEKLELELNSREQALSDRLEKEMKQRETDFKESSGENEIACQKNTLSAQRDNIKGERGNQNSTVKAILAERESAEKAVEAMKMQLEAANTVTKIMQLDLHPSESGSIENPNNSPSDKDVANRVRAKIKSSSAKSARDRANEMRIKTRSGSAYPAKATAASATDPQTGTQTEPATAAAVEHKSNPSRNNPHIDRHPPKVSNSPGKKNTAALKKKANTLHK